MMQKNQKRTTIPKNWLGYWRDTNNKQLLIEEGPDSTYLISVFDEHGKPYCVLFFIEKSTQLPAKFSTNRNGYPILQTEAGCPGLGPTYNLLFGCIDSEDKLQVAKDEDPLDRLRIEPGVGMGLYDDFEDDFGVPWAFPLAYFKKVTH